MYIYINQQVATNNNSLHTRIYNYQENITMIFMYMCTSSHLHNYIYQGFIQELYVRGIAKDYDRGYGEGCVGCVCVWYSPLPPKKHFKSRP